ncbi:ABC transporter permease [Mycolicibacterium sediminis]|uniref:Transport permease protein n=1 Tax=Mycolicibacterium sediminis TaxID=1286180 RepID=A0A7I7QP76_9MYCO|nr:ABC transporter permease [Mycolicibacterium sediminis]BBY28012.1 putative doxorubicin resistance ABC transporter permease protein DrrC [Mycolicibacterium sediminis]
MTFTSQTRLQAGRLLRRWTREPVVLIQALIFPTFLLVVYKLVIGESVRGLTGTDSLYGLVPMCAIVGAMFGAIGAGAALPDERESGLLSRLWALPVHRASALSGRLLAEAGRALVGAVAIAAVGVAMGLRFTQGPVAAIGFLLVPVLMVIGFATVIIAVGVRANGKNIITGISTVCFLLLFFNSGMVPIDVFPGWLQPVVRAQPMSPAIEAMRGLADGGPILWPVLQSVAWVAGLLAVFGPIAVRGYRVAAESGT